MIFCDLFNFTKCHNASEYNEANDVGVLTSVAAPVLVWDVMYADYLDVFDELGFCIDNATISLPKQWINSPGLAKKRNMDVYLYEIRIIPHDCVIRCAHHRCTLMLLLWLKQK